MQPSPWQRRPPPSRSRAAALRWHTRNPALCRHRPRPPASLPTAPTVSATSTSGLTVSFSTSGNCTNSTTTVTITGAGTCTVTASQAGNANYNAASDVARTFNIAKANQTITFNALNDSTYGGSPIAISATASSGLTVSFGTSGNCSYGSGAITLTGAGTCTVTASQAGNANYKAAPEVADLHDREIAARHHVQHARRQDLRRECLCRLGQRIFGTHRHVHHLGRLHQLGHDRHDHRGRFLHGNRAPGRERRLRPGTRPGPHVHDQQGQPDDHVRRSRRQDVRRCSFRRVRYRQFEPDGDVHDGGQLHQLRHDRDGHRRRHLHRDRVAERRQQLQRRIRRRPHLHDREGRPGNHLQRARRCNLR